MIRGILLGILTIGAISTVFWGYKEHQEKNAVLIHAENNYQRAFHNLAYHVDLLHEKIGNTLAMNSRSSLSPSLAEVWRISSQAHSDVGQLPLTLLPFNKTEEFLAKVGEFSYQAAIRDLDKEPLHDTEYKTLQELYKNSSDIQHELRGVQHLVLKNNLRWMDVELALAANKTPSDNKIIDGFKTVEKNAMSYSETKFGPASAGLEKEQKGLLRTNGNMVAKEEAKDIARNFLGVTNIDTIQVEENGQKTDTPFYSLSIQNKNANSITYMDITKQGGFPIWVLNNRDVGKQSISLHDAGNRGLDFIKKHGFENMELYEASQFDNIGVFTYVTNINGIRIYPEAINVKVGLDDGTIIGFSARDYVSSYNKRTIPKPRLSIEEARKKINQNVKVMEEREAVILNNMQHEVLCYEFTGTLENETYQIFINADDGTEEKVKQLKNVEATYE